jgi:hypothetical protein
VAICLQFATTTSVSRAAPAFDVDRSPPVVSPDRPQLQGSPGTLSYFETEGAHAIDPTAVDPTAVDPTAVDPTEVDPTAMLSPRDPTQSPKASKGKKKQKKQKKEKKTKSKSTKVAKFRSPLANDDDDDDDDDGVSNFSNPLTADEGPANDWPMRNGKMVLDVKRGREMRGAVQKLYNHLRQESVHSKAAGGKDNFGLWDHLGDSDDEDEGDGVYHAGEIHMDEDFVKSQLAVKKTKHAMKVGNADKMNPEDVKRDLEKYGKSTKGDMKSLRQRLKATYEQEAAKMRGNTRVVQHFTSELTTRNIQLMVLKVNQTRTAAVQDKLKGAHTDLAQAQAAIREMQAEIEAQRAMLSDLRSQVDKKPNERVVVRKVTEPMGVPKMALTMAVSTKQSGTLKANWSAWSIGDIAQEKAQSTMCQVLVLDTSGFKWENVFKKMKTKDGRAIKCRHSAWHLINVASTSHFGGQAVVDQLVVTEEGAAHERFIPECVLIRDSCRQVNGEDHTHQLMGFICSRTPCVNDAGAILNCLDRPVVYSELLNIRNKEGEKDGEFKFPLVEQEYFANEAPASIKPTFPAVTKLSTTASGFGKLRAADSASFAEVSSILALSSEYYTTEESMTVTSEIYVQWINGNIRCFKRVKSSCDDGFRTWSNWGTVQYQELDDVKKYKKWAELVSKTFGGLDIFALNIVQTDSGVEYILGMQDTSCPFAPQYQSEDSEHCVELVLDRIDKTRKERAKYVMYN